MKENPNNSSLVTRHESENPAFEKLSLSRREFLLGSSVLLATSSLEQEMNVLNKIFGFVKKWCEENILSEKKWKLPEGCDKSSEIDKAKHAILLVFSNHFDKVVSSVDMEILSYEVVIDFYEAFSENDLDVNFPEPPYQKSEVAEMKGSTLQELQEYAEKLRKMQKYTEAIRKQLFHYFKKNGYFFCDGHQGAGKGTVEKKLYLLEIESIDKINPRDYFLGDNRVSDREVEFHFCRNDFISKKLQEKGLEYDCTFLGLVDILGNVAINLSNCERGAKHKDVTYEDFLEHAIANEMGNIIFNRIISKDYSSVITNWDSFSRIRVGDIGEIFSDLCSQINSKNFPVWYIESLFYSEKLKKIYPFNGEFFYKEFTVYLNTAISNRKDEFREIIEQNIIPAQISSPEELLGVMEFLAKSPEYEFILKEMSTRTAKQLLGETFVLGKKLRKKMMMRYMMM